jgi:ComF family protein
MDKFFLYRGFWKALDWLYPPVCGGCGRFGERWCLNCHTSTSYISEPVCPICGKPQPKQTLCTACNIEPPPFRMLRSFAIYKGSLRHAIIQLKYRRNLGMAEILADYLLTLYNNYNMKVDLITAVPLSPLRQRQRGYNQSALIAYALGLATKLQYRSDLIIRTRDTASQVNLNAIERKQNVHGAFLGNSKKVKGKNILLIDDVITTGATMHACSQALLDAGAKDIFAMTVARAGLGINSNDYIDL